MAFLDLVAGDSGDELVATHANVTVETPDRDRDSLLTEGAVPGERVVVVRVDKRAVDVNERCAKARHRLHLPPPARHKTLRRSTACVSCLRHANVGYHQDSEHFEEAQSGEPSADRY